jgi:hypothetical protein
MIIVLNDSIGRHRVAVDSPSLCLQHMELLWMELTGPEQACKAIHAHIVQGRTTHNLTKTNVVTSEGASTQSIYVQPQAGAYFQVRKPDGLIVASTKLDRLHCEVIMWGDEETPSPWFGRAMNKIENVPYLPEWLPRLWTLGLQRGTIHELPAQAGDIRFWEVKQVYTYWRQIIQEIVTGKPVKGRYG